MMETVLLWLFAGTALAGAALMLVLRHPMRVAVALTGAMLSLAGVYALLGVHVIAIFQVLIYVGAIMVFMVYAIMLLDVRDRSYTLRFSRLLIPGVVAAALLAGVLLYAAYDVLSGRGAAAGSGTLFALQSFSVAFLNEYWLHFELVSVLLVAAVVASVAVLEIGRKRG
jgi:NADH-quinone oxidoreductase subunit J